ncbi:MAG: carboxypeptidase-like regulatory domain-containing protein, partial [bacterium]
MFSPAEDASGPVPVAIEFAYGFVLDAASAPEATPDEAPPPSAEAPINLDGVLLELGSREPVASAAIRVTTADARTFDTTTGPDGRWSVRGVPPGTATVTAAMPGFDRSERAVEVLDGQLTT